MPFAKLAVVAVLGAGAVSLAGAEAIRPIDASRRNDAMSPENRIAPPSQAPAANTNLQEKRVEKAVIDRSLAPVGGKQAAITLEETRPKEIRQKDTRPPVVNERVTSPLNGRQAPISTGATSRPPTVSKYQDSLTAASAANMARFPALDGATTAKINRFVFRKNPPDPEPRAGRAVPAAGGPGGTPDR